MSTRIDINVAKALLQRLAKAASDANRRGLQERERRKKLEAEGNAEREKARRENGLGPDGKPLGRPPLRYQFREEPAATPQIIPTGSTGFAWLLFPRLSPGFSGAQRWRDPNTQQKIITDNDTFSFKVGSGDGTQWVNATMSLPGIAAWRSTIAGLFQPAANDRYPGDTAYATDPIGKYTDALTGNPPTGTFTVDDTKLQFFSMPCGNGSAIVVVHVRAAANFRGMRYLCTESSFRPANPATGQLEGYEVTQQEPLYVRRLNVTACDLSAFVVSHTQCREVQVPPALQSAFEELSWNTSWTRPYPDDPDENLSLPEPTSPYWITLESGFAFRLFDQIIYNPLFSAFGASDYVMEFPAPFHRTTALANSPAVYLLLNTYANVLSDYKAEYSSDDSIFNSYYYDYALGREVLQNYGAPAPAHVAGFDARLSDYQAISTALYNGLPGYNTWPSRDIYRDVDELLQGISVVKSNALPVAFGDQLPQDGAWRQIKRLTLSEPRPDIEASDQDDYNMLWHYDWGKPAFCRQQLLALGFTAEDLTP